MNSEVLTLSDDESDIEDDFGESLEKLRKKIKIPEYKIERFADWERPKPNIEDLLCKLPDSNAENSTCFQFFFLDAISTISNVTHPILEHEDKMANQRHRNVMRLFGVVPAHGSSVSVCVNAHGFCPYFYAVPNVDCSLNEKNSMEAIINLELELNIKATLQVLQKPRLAKFISVGQRLVRLETMEFGVLENKLFGLPSIKNKNALVLKVVVLLPMFVSVVSNILRNVIHPWKFDIFEENVCNNIRFLSACNIYGSCWLELKQGKFYSRVSRDLDLEPETHCHFELDAYFKDVLIVDKQTRQIPPLVVLSFDIECRLLENSGSDSKHSSGQIIQIGAIVSNYCPHTKKSTTIGKAIFVLGTCADILDARLVQFYDKYQPNDSTEPNLRDKEASALAAFRTFVIQIDPDILTGYNIKNFDFPHLLERVNKSPYCAIKTFPYLGRLRHAPVLIRRITNPNKRMYKHDEHSVYVHGRIILDMRPIYQYHFPYETSFKLRNLAKLCFDEQACKVEYAKINWIQDKGDKSHRQELAMSCLDDAYLAYKLALLDVPSKGNIPKDFLQYYFDLSKSTGIIIRYLFNKSREVNNYFKLILSGKRK